MCEKARETFRAINLRRIERGAWLNGAPLLLNGFRVVQETPAAKAVDLPAFVNLPARRLTVELREEMLRALATEVAAACLQPAFEMVAGWLQRQQEPLLKRP
jgi:hypothetical protein